MVLSSMVTFTDGWTQYKGRHSGSFTVNIGNFDFLTTRPMHSHLLPDNDSLHLYLNVDYDWKEATSDLISLQLGLLEKDQEEIPLRYTLSLLSIKEEKKFRKEYFTIFKFVNHLEAKPFHLKRKQVENDFSLFHNGHLIVSIDFQVMEAINWRLVNDLEKISLDYGALLQSGKGADVRLIVSGRIFSAHKLILASRSAVFAAMFEHDCLEKSDGSVLIPDIDPETFEQLLRYIYCGKVDHLNRLALELLEAADKYQLGSLKFKCEQHLLEPWSPVDTSNVCETLLLAEMHHCLALKEKCIKLIQSHKEEVEATDGWKQFIASRPNYSLHFDL